MKIAIGIVFFIAALFCITGSIPNILSDVIIIRPEFFVGYAIGIGLLFASSRMFQKQYFTLVVGLAALLAGLHMFLFLYLVSLKNNFGILLGCIYILIAISMTVLFIRSRKMLPPQKATEETLATAPVKGIGQTKPKARKAILYWGAFLVVMSVWPLFDTPLPPGQLRFQDFSYSRLVATSSIPMKALLVAGGVISFAFCFIWYRLLQVREQRSRFARTIGGVLFMLGSVILVVIFGIPGQTEVMMVNSPLCQ